MLGDLKSISEVCRPEFIKAFDFTQFKSIQIMLAIQAIYDGAKFIPLEKIPTKGKFKVIITFVEALDGEEDIRNFAAQTDSFTFWENEKEDIYQDFLAEKTQ